MGSFNFWGPSSMMIPMAWWKDLAVMPSSDQPSDRISSLDGWRAVAILMVLVAHLYATTNVPELTGLLGFMTRHGNLGVRIFFVLSGYLITLLLLQEAEKRGTISLKQFYFRRMSRIFPVYYAYLAVVAGLQLVGMHHENASSWLGALTFTRNYIGQNPSLTTHFWSLAVEEQFYVLWPVSLALGLHKRWHLAIAALVCAIFAGAAFRLIDCHEGIFCTRIAGPGSLFRYLDSLAAGCLLAFIQARAGVGVPERWLGRVLYASLFGLFTTMVYQAKTPIASSLEVLSQACLVAIAIHCSIRAPHTAAYKVLNSIAATGIGVISYSLYVWHVLFLSDASAPGSTSVFFDWRIWWIPAFVVAALSYHFYERPIIIRAKSFLHRSSDRIARKLDRQREGAAKERYAVPDV
jgi:peptidoglycan/LPS O-acetylase OafA/YrhL